MYRMIIIVILAGLLAGCQAKVEEPLSRDTGAVPTFAGVNSLSTLPGYTEPVQPTSPVAVSRFPIEPDAAGQGLYDTYCASCHGISGEGQYPNDPYGPNAAGLLGAPPHDNSGHTWHHPDPVLFEVIYNGRTAPNFMPMPGFRGQLSPEEIVSILAYIKTWWGEQELDVQRRGTEAYLEP